MLEKGPLLPLVVLIAPAFFRNLPAGTIIVTALPATSHA